MLISRDSLTDEIQDGITMKTLKICRTASFVPMMAFLIVFFVYRTLDKGFEGILATTFGLIFIFGPVSFYTRIKNESNPVYLAKTEKGMIIANFVSIVLMTALSIVGFCWGVGGYFTWLYLAIVSAVIYSTTNNIILYKAKKAYDIENNIKNS